MAFVRYTARRSLIAGHVAGTDYEIEFTVRRATRSRVPSRVVQKSIAGDRETLYNRADETWSILSSLIDEADLEDWREFMDSVEDGQAFQLDPFGTVASPSSDLMTGYAGQTSEARTEPNWYRFSIRFERSV